MLVDYQNNAFLVLLAYHRHSFASQTVWFSFINLNKRTNWRMEQSKGCNATWYSMVQTVFTSPTTYRYVDQGELGGTPGTRPITSGTVLVPLSITNIGHIIWYKAYTTWYKWYMSCNGQFFLLFFWYFYSLVLKLSTYQCIDTWDTIPVRTLSGTVIHKLRTLEQSRRTLTVPKFTYKRYMWQQKIRKNYITTQKSPWAPHWCWWNNRLTSLVLTKQRERIQMANFYRNSSNFLVICSHLPISEHLSTKTTIASFLFFLSHVVQTLDEALCDFSHPQRIPIDQK